jgi:predicted CXXCH cytochrome family protein
MNVRGLCHVCYHSNEPLVLDKRKIAVCVGCKD